LNRAKVIDAATESSRVTAKRAVGEHKNVDVKDASARRGSRVAAESAVRDRLCPGTVVVGAAAGASRVPADCAVGDGQRATVKNTSSEPGTVAADYAAVYGDARIILVVNPAASSTGVAVPDREARDSDCQT